MDVVEAIRRDGGDAAASPHVAELYTLARDEGGAYLRRFANIAEADRSDHIHEVLSRSLPALIAADNPRAFFRIALRNQVIDSLRRRREELTGSDGEQSAAPGSGPPTRLTLTETLALIHATSSPRDAAVFLSAVTCGDEIDEVAAAFGISVANVYTIVSRIRKRLRLITGETR